MEFIVADLLPALENISLDQWDQDVFRENDLQVDVLRLDKIHPEISGNKWFKLKNYLLQAKQENKKKLVSFGGAYSNHLIALAEFSRLYGFSSAAFIRGEEPVRLSHTLQAAKKRGMELRFLPRREYQEKKQSVFLTGHANPETAELLIPEGGAGKAGIRGAAEILSCLPTAHYSHICCAVGTGATLAGLVNSAGPDQKIFGVSVLKGTIDFEPLQDSWITLPASLKNVQLIHEDHFGGYAKTSKSLFNFMNRVFSESGIPTDFVYTGKLFFSVERMAAGKIFPAGSRILVLHTGGLQGNRSLAPGLLQF
jgi:1-aminocyclopropane-1-carboxylate deaminase